MIEIMLQKTAAVWSQWVLVSLLESAVMLLLVLLVWGVIRKKCPQGVGYILFLLVMIKLLIPVGIPLPGVFAKYTPSHLISQMFSPREIREITSVINANNANLVIVEQPVEYPVEQPVEYSVEQPMEPITLPEPEPVIVPEPIAEPTVVSENVVSKSYLPVTVWLMLTWIATVVFLMLRFAVTQWRFMKSLRRRQPINDLRFYPQLLSKKQVPVFACPNIATPAVCGFFRPMILFPEEMLRRLSEEQLRWVLLHELAHVRRRDLQTAFLQRMATMLHFYNPVVWVASYFLNHLRESACDDMALAADATIPRKMIGDALLNIVEHSAVVDRPISGALGAFDFASSVRRRLVRLLDKKRILHTKTGVGSMILLFLTTVLLVPQWQAMPTVTVVAENTVVENTASAPDEVLKSIPSEDTQLDEKYARLLDLYTTQVTLANQDFRFCEEYHKQQITTDEELAEMERRLLKAKITLSKFIIDNGSSFIRDPDTIKQERENLLSCYQRLFELAKQDYVLAEKFAATGNVSEEELRMWQRKMIDTEILVVENTITENNERAAVPLELLKLTGVPPNVINLEQRRQQPKNSPALTSGEQERLQALYRQIIDQEELNLQSVQGMYDAGHPRSGGLQALIEAQRGVIRAKIDLTTFLLNETELTSQDYARERQNLRWLYEELREAAKSAVEAANASFESGTMGHAELAQYERKLTEAEIALIRLFPEQAANVKEEIQSNPPQETAAQVITVYKLEHILCEKAVDMLQPLIPNVRITSDPRTNSLVIATTPEERKIIEGTLQELDQKEEKKVSAVYYWSENISLETAKDILQPLFPNASIRIYYNNKSLIITATPEEHKRIGDFLGKLRQFDKKPVEKSYPIKNADPKTVLAVMQTMFAETPEVKLSLDPKTNSLIIFGNELVHGKVAAVQKVLDSPPPAVP